MKNCHVIRNDYLCSDNIKFAMVKNNIPLKLKSALVRRLNLISEAQVIESIEKAVLSYYDLSLDDIDSVRDTPYDSYVYIYMHPLIEGRWHLYGKEYVLNKPLYVGKGYGDRKESHLKYSANSELGIAIQSLVDKGLSPIINVFNDGCTSEMAYNLENYIIARLREQGVDLCNGTRQNKTSKYTKDIIISTFNIEKIRNSLIVDALNSAKTYREAAKLLGVSERCLYRRVKSLKLVNNNGIWQFSDKMTSTTQGTKVVDYEAKNLNTDEQWENMD
jgi:hypothetical protein